ncbi:MAG: DUF2764 family protein [Clostridia bacterium]|nr:DUF2764 family protein [Clostridia bacterium]
MAEYYLISQLPSLDAVSDGTPIPIGEERFLELCREHLSRKALKEIENLTILPPMNPEPTSSALLGAWYEGERNLRLALGKARAEKMNKSFDIGDASMPLDILKVAGDATETENPLEAEKILFAYRLAFLEKLRPMDAFSEDYLFYYGLKLKLISRMRKFDAELGGAAYRDIYDSILNGDRTEAIQ